MKRKREREERHEDRLNELLPGWTAVGYLITSNAVATTKDISILLFHFMFSSLVLFPLFFPLVPFDVG